VLVKTEATVDPPIEEPPIEDDPPIVTPPIEDDPPIVTPPIEDDPPIVTPPVEDDPSIVTPPIEDDAPIETPPIETPFVKPAGNGLIPVKAAGVKKTGISISAVTLSWKVNAKNTFYEVVCTSHSDAIVGMVEVVNGKPTVTITGLSPGVKYKFEIISYNGETAAAKKTKVSVKTKTYAAPKIVKKITTSDSITLSWKPSPFAETSHYEIYDSSGKLLGTTTGVSWTYAELTPSTIYKFEIRAVSDLLGGIASKVKKVSAKTKKL
jgi:hypothetical protein